MPKKGRILLTGGSGMVGRNILEHPAAVDWEILAPSSRDLDLRDYNRTAAFVAEAAVDIVIHAAGRVGGIQANIAAPVDFLVANLDLGRNVVMAARAAGVQRLINLGSSCMYPRGAAAPFSEDRVLTGEFESTNEGYALAKVVTARLCQYVGRENPELNYKTLIPCNIFGRYDNFDPARSHLLAAVIHKLHTAKSANHGSVEIWGDGTARREFMFAGDLADAVLRAASSFESLPDVMNLGQGQDYTVDEYYAAAAEVIGWKGAFVHDPARPVGMERKLVSIARQTRWGWRPATSLKEGIEKAYAYYRAVHAR